MTDRARAANREIRRLWDLKEPGKPGPSSTFTARHVARAAIAIADRDGLESVSMRKIAERLSVSAMALYTHVPSKTELLAVMVDQVCSEIEGPPPGHWKQRVRAIALENLRLYVKHPWLQLVDDHRPVLGPFVLAKYEVELQAFEGLGLADWEIDAVLGSLLAFTRGCAQAEVARIRTEKDSGHSDAEWWADRQPLLAQLDLEKRFPMASRVGSAVGERANAPRSSEDMFELGLECWLLGVEEFLRRRNRVKR